MALNLAITELIQTGQIVRRESVNRESSIVNRDQQPKNNQLLVTPEKTLCYSVVISF
jgi:hypothetical protein